MLFRSLLTLKLDDYFYFYDAAVGSAPTNAVVLDGRWHHLLAVHADAAYSLYLDGIRVANFTNTHVMEASDGTRHFWLGSSVYTTSGPRDVALYRGQMDDVRIYNRALSDSEVQQLYAYESAPANAQSLPLPQANFELIQAIQDQSSHVWVLGAFTNSVTLGTNTFTSRGQRDALLVQYSPAGVVNWAATIGGVYDDVGTTGYVPWGIRMSVQSNMCVIAGWERSSLTVVDGGKVTSTTAYDAGNQVREGVSDGFLLHFNSAGQLLWKASVTGISATDGGQSTAIDNSGNVYWAGLFNGCCPSQGSATVTDGLGSSTSITTSSFGTGFLIKFNSSGAYQWSAKCYNRDASFEYGVAVDNAGAVFVAGNSRSSSSGAATTLVDAGGNVQSVANGGYQSTFLAKFSSSGIYEWA